MAIIRRKKDAEAPDSSPAPTGTASLDGSASDDERGPAAVASESAGGESTTAPVVESEGEAQAPAQPAAGRMRGRLFGRLSRSGGGIGAALASIFSGTADAAVWESLEESLLLADVGVTATAELVNTLQRRLGGASTAEDARAVVREELLAVVSAGAVDVDPSAERTLNLQPPSSANAPQVVMVVGVNGTGKTTTTGKLARLLTSQGYRVVLAAADTFRAAAAEQLHTWGERCGVPVVSKAAGADPASVAYDAYEHAVSIGADVLLVDTAGRLHTKQGLMDELGKVARVLSRHGAIAHTLLVLDATTGQNGLRQARVFSEVVPVSSVALTKLDGTAKGGIVVAVQRDLAIPVSLVGLGEGADDLAYFDPASFVDALLS